MLVVMQQERSLELCMVTTDPEENSFLDYVVFCRVAGVACAKYVLNRKVNTPMLSL